MRVELHANEYFVVIISTSSWSPPNQNHDLHLSVTKAIERHRSCVSLHKNGMCVEEPEI